MSRCGRQAASRTPRTTRCTPWRLARSPRRSVSCPGIDGERWVKSGCRSWHRPKRISGRLTSRRISRMSTWRLPARSPRWTASQPFENARRSLSIRLPERSNRSTSRASTSRTMHSPTRWPRACGNQTARRSSSSRHRNATAGSNRTRWAHSVTARSGE